jgi:hypothetical protein
MHNITALCLFNETEALKYPSSVIPYNRIYRIADKSLARPERKQATATEDFDVHMSYLKS